jgi:hypothetical protein
MTMRKLLILLLSCIVFLPIGTCTAFPSSSFTESFGEWLDDWNINRNYYGGKNGYLPNLAYETLNENKELAYSIGESFQAQYTQKTERARAILRYVQQWTEYGYDEDNVYMNGVAQEEWAWNADETANRFNQTTGAVAIGDCEDMAFLCGTIYMGAGFDAAIVDAPGHVALLIWLPEFDNADNYWDIPDDNRGSGWIWVEATGDSNPLGWTPSDYEYGDWTAYPLGTIEPIEEDNTTTPTEFFSTDIIVPVVVIGVIFVILSLASTSRSRKRSNYLPPPSF